MHHVMGKQASSATADLALLQELNHGFIRSVRTSDVAWFDRNLTDDFLNSNADGTLADRVTFLRQIEAPCPVSNFSVEDVRIRIFGDTAIAHGRTIYTKCNGEAAAGRYTDVWVRQSARWVCVSGDVTRG
jgi:ketosteroid isomerase-like protein